MKYEKVYHIMDDDYIFHIAGEVKPAMVDKKVQQYEFIVKAPWYNPEINWNVPSDEIMDFVPRLKGGMGMIMTVGISSDSPKWSFGFTNSDDAMLFKLSMGA